MTLVDLVSVLVVVAGGLAAAVEWWRDRRTPNPGTVAHAQHLYATGDIDHAELERRLDVLADPEARRIRQASERVNGIGEATSWALAAEFDSLAELRDADRERLESVVNVGEQRADAIQDEV